MPPFYGFISTHSLFLFRQFRTINWYALFGATRPLYGTDSCVSFLIHFIGIGHSIRHLVMHIVCQNAINCQYREKSMGYQCGTLIASHWIVHDPEQIGFMILNPTRNPLKSLSVSGS